jgi:hypothetical protein
MSAGSLQEQLDNLWSLLENHYAITAKDDKTLRELDGFLCDEILTQKQLDNAKAKLLRNRLKSYDPYNYTGELPAYFKRDRTVKVKAKLKYIRELNKEVRVKLPRQTQKHFPTLQKAIAYRNNKLGYDPDKVKGTPKTTKKPKHEEVRDWLVEFCSTNGEYDHSFSVTVADALSASKDKQLSRKQYDVIKTELEQSIIPWSVNDVEAQKQHKPSQPSKQNRVILNGFKQSHFAV